MTFHIIIGGETLYYELVREITRGKITIWKALGIKRVKHGKHKRMLRDDPDLVLELKSYQGDFVETDNGQAFAYFQ